MSASVTVVICTKDREHTLFDCVKHAALSVKKASTAFDSKVLILDDGNLTPEYLQRVYLFTDDLNIRLTYFKKSAAHQKGLYGSRKLAAEIVDTTHLLFIDDDCMLAPTYVQRAMQMVDEDNSIAAVSGVDRRNLVKPTLIQAHFWRLFLLSGGHNGKLSRTGFNYGHSYWLAETDVFESDFVHGCNMLFRTETLKALPDCPWLEGHSMCEDLVLAHTASQYGKILIDPDLEFDHLETPGGRGNALKRLQRKIRSHFKFSRMRNGSGISDLLFAWSVAGGLLHIAIKMLASRIGIAVHVKK